MSKMKKALVVIILMCQTLESMTFMTNNVIVTPSSRRLNKKNKVVRAFTHNGAALNSVSDGAAIENKINGHNNDDTNNNSNVNDNEEINAFEMIASLAVTTLYQSDIKRDAKSNTNGSTGSGSSATNWIDDRSSYALTQALNQIELKLPDERIGLDRDEALSWLRWMKTSPTPLIVDLTHFLIEAGKQSISKEALDMIDTNEGEFYSRIGCKLYLFPSGSELKSPIVESTGAIIFGKLLYGGVTRYRLLNSSTSKRLARRVGEQTAIKSTRNDHVPCWTLFGGSDRQYLSIDMGSAAVLEVTVLPKGKKMTSILETQSVDMAMARMDWKPNQMFHFPKNEALSTDNIESPDLSIGNLAMSLAGKDRNDAFKADFETAVGGLQPQIEAIIRRVLDGRGKFSLCSR